MTPLSDTLVSVIVPLYNVAPYLPACLDGLLTQTHRGLEVVLVDDGSTDGSGAVCDAYAARDGRVRVLHQHNAGVAAARNAGLDQARGAYISFVDSDDVVSPRFIETLLGAGADIAQCGFVTELEGLRATDEADRPAPAFERMSSRDASRALQLDGTGTWGVLWNKLYRASLFDGLRFPVGRQHEDEFVVWRTLWAAGGVAVTPEPLYFYRQRQGSIMAAGLTQKSLDALVAIEQRGTFYRAQGDAELADLSDAVLCHRAGRVLAGDAAALDPAELASWRSKRDALLKRLLASPHLSAKKKAALLARRILPGL